MRTATLALILAVAWRPLTAQQAAAISPSQPSPKGTAAQSAASREAAQAAVEAPDSGTVRLSASAIDSLHRLIERFRHDPEAVALPPNEQISMGGRSIAAASQVDGPVAAAGGPLHVYGTVNGDAIAIGSDVIVHPGGRVTGNAVSALGSVTV